MYVLGRSNGKPKSRVRVTTTIPLSIPSNLISRTSISRRKTHTPTHHTPTCTEIDKHPFPHMRVKLVCEGKCHATFYFPMRAQCPVFWWGGKFIMCYRHPTSFSLYSLVSPLWVRKWGENSILVCDVSGKRRKIHLWSSWISILENINVGCWSQKKG